MDALFIRILIPLAVVVVFALARRYLPVTGARVEPRSGSVDELDSGFASKQWVVSLSMVIVGGFFLFAVHATLVYVNRHLATQGGGALFVIYPESAIWWFFPGFGALALPWEITLRAMSLLGFRAEADSYNYWSSLKAGFDCRRLLRWLALVVVAPIAVVTLLALPMHSALRQDNIQNCGYAFAKCKNYAYAMARRMTIVDGFRRRDGKLTRRAEVVVDFQDGSRWISTGMGEFKSSVNPVLVQLLESKTGLLYGHADTESDIPPVASTTANPPR